MPTSPVGGHLEMRGLFASFACVLALTGCVGVSVNGHIAAKDYAKSPKRILILNRLDEQFEASMPQLFADAIVPALARCSVSALVYRPDAMELDAEAKLAAAIAKFDPDTVLNINQTRRLLQDGQVRSGFYVLTLSDLSQKRFIWKADIGVGASARFLADRRVAGGNFADEVVRSLAGDAIIKTCPPFPPKTGS